jgi:glucose uptake protein
MYQPEAYGIALLFMIGSMLCWGSWANTMKLTPGWPFQLFYWDYVIGIVAASLLWDSRSVASVEENFPS